MTTAPNLDDYEYLQDQIYYHEAPSDVLFQEYLRDLYQELNDNN